MVRQPFADAEENATHAVGGSDVGGFKERDLPGGGLGAESGEGAGRVFDRGEFSEEVDEVGGQIRLRRPIVILPADDADVGFGGEPFG